MIGGYKVKNSKMLYQVGIYAFITWLQIPLTTKLSEGYRRWADERRPVWQTVRGHDCMALKSPHPVQSLYTFMKCVLLVKDGVFVCYYFDMESAHVDHFLKKKACQTKKTDLT